MVFMSGFVETVSVSRLPLCVEVGMVLPGKGAFYALEFGHSDTEIFQIFLDHANRAMEFERPRNLLIQDNASLAQEQITGLVTI